MLISLFERCMKRRGVKESDPFDWEKQTGDTQPVTQMSQVPPTTTAPTTMPRQTAKLLTTTDNNQENIEPTDNKEVSGQFSKLNLIFCLLKGKYVSTVKLRYN